MVAILSYHYRDFRQERILAMNMKEAFKFLRKKVNRKLRKRRQTEEEDSHSQVLSPVRQLIMSSSSCQMCPSPLIWGKVMNSFCHISRHIFLFRNGLQDFFFKQLSRLTLTVHSKRLSRSVTKVSWEYFNQTA